MILCKEKYFPCELEPDDSQTFIRLNIFRPAEIDSFLSLSKASCHKPMLTAPMIKENHHALTKDFFAEVLKQYEDITERLYKKGFDTIVLAADDDSVWQNRLSPRFFVDDLEDKITPLIDTFKAMTALVPNVLMALTVEELAPGGMDATDGIYILKKLAKLGLKEAIVSAGTRDFLPLFNRRITKHKEGSMAFHSREPELATAALVLQNTQLKVWSLAFISDDKHASMLAHKIGLSGIINRAFS